MNNKDGILKFYDAIKTQGIQYRIFLCPENHIDKTHVVKSDDISNESSEVTSTITFTKLIQEGIIDANYKKALSIQYTTKCGYQLLQLMFYHDHAQLNSHIIDVRNIPKYSTISNLYFYTKSMVVFIKTHKLKRHQYSLSKETVMYIAHLDCPLYEKWF